MICLLLLWFACVCACVKWEVWSGGVTLCTTWHAVQSCSDQGDGTPWRCYRMWHSTDCLPCHWVLQDSQVSTANLLAGWRFAQHRDGQDLGPVRPPLSVFTLQSVRNVYICIYCILYLCVLYFITYCVYSFYFISVLHARLICIIKYLLLAYLLT